MFNSAVGDGAPTRGVLITATTQYGVLVPHFGSEATPTNLESCARTAEELGFDSLWVRDHVVYHPHGLEDPDPTFVETFTTLSYLAAVTQEVTLGTAVAIPTRHPIILAQLYASLSYLAGRPVIAGLGAGNAEHELEAVGRPFADRGRLVEEAMELMPKIWSGESVSYDGDQFSFEDIEVHPSPVEPVEIWYGSYTPAGIRRTAAYADGWLPARIADDTLEFVYGKLEELCVEHDREMPTVGSIPVTSIDRDRETALGKIDVDPLLEWANSKPHFIKPESGRFETAEDLAGTLIAGSPEDVRAGTQRQIDIGVDHVIFDLRLRYDELEYCLELIADEVIPALD